MDTKDALAAAADPLDEALAIVPGDNSSMQPSDFFSTFLHFFYDAIGVVIPGLVFLLLLGLGYAPARENWASIAEYGSVSVLAFLVLGYATGHALLGIYSPIEKWARKLAKRDRKIDAQSVTYQTFQTIVNRELLGAGSDSPCIRDHDLRSFAMSISAEGAELGRRFMFLSLLCSGLATGICILLLLSFGLPNAKDFGSVWWGRPAALVIAASLFWRGLQFERRALNVPFPVALAALTSGSMRVSSSSKGTPQDMSASASDSDASPKQSVAAGEH